MNKVIVIGPDHQNTLGVIRAIAKGKMMVDLIVFGEEPKHCRCRKSKCLNGQYTYCRADEKEIVEAILRIAGDEKEIPIIPTSDFAEYCIDKNLNILSRKCKVPSIKDNQGAIYQLMDKYAQKQFADQHGLPMAKSVVLSTAIRGTALQDGWKYPVILKPIISAEGKKEDIVIVNNSQSLTDSINKYKNNGYRSVLMQEFIHKDYEICVFGCITQNSRDIFCGALKKIRYSPVGDGASLSFAEFIPVSEEILGYVRVLKDIGYDGLFDIELFAVGNDLYLNEINFRNSGNTWSIVKNGINAPYIWVQDAIGEKIHSTEKTIQEKLYFMNETADFKNVLLGKIDVLSWVRDLTRTSAFNKFWLHDIRGSIAWYKK